MKAGPMWVAPRTHKVFQHFADELMGRLPEMLDALRVMWKMGATAEAWLEWNERLYPTALDILRKYMRDSSVERVPLLLCKGDVVIFSNSLIHGTFLTEDPSLPRRAFYTHYHASSCELWDLGDGIGSQANPNRVPYQKKWAPTKYGLTYPSCMCDYYGALKGFLDL
jgi:ectoine hydroxylase-related dioxygenase (phytanoyl-CoA dioxygenase family)